MMELGVVRAPATIPVMLIWALRPFQKPSKAVWAISKALPLTTLILQSWYRTLIFLNSSLTTLARSGSSVVSFHEENGGGGFDTNLWVPKPLTKAWRRAIDTSGAASVADSGKNAIPLS